ncbi:antibiotic biosynthesis monooxygenase [Gracilibacillus sp. S3-1-1]|uniref:Antibiotic biosynthesis monooxygenase n=1 Tax=Gracilibacillus pellucidus TaxID=3095368 RepID=A0ACC6M430_9BACI|nr:antibiotic biosynthesis monooxygenase [Gracilibacillus sp. S3-1-1]MDX8045729.1 antibiotic biosynthesis monooxygenase [Gracilibacillus sp. S3-1-1]
MKAYMTNGTYSYLEKLKTEQHVSPLLLLNNEVKTVAYYEDPQPSIFATSRNFTIIGQRGKLAEEGFVSIVHIPVTIEGRPIFELEYNERIERIKTAVAIRLLRPQTGNTYILFIEWLDSSAYKEWKQTNPLPHKKEDPYIAGPVYTETFHVGEE